MKLFLRHYIWYSIYNNYIKNNTKDGSFVSNGKGLEISHFMEKTLCSELIWYFFCLHVPNARFYFKALIYKKNTSSTHDLIKKKVPISWCYLLIFPKNHIFFNWPIYNFFLFFFFKPHIKVWMTNTDGCKVVIILMQSAPLLNSESAKFVQ